MRSLDILLDLLLPGVLRLMGCCLHHGLLVLFVHLLLLPHCELLADLLQDFEDDVQGIKILVLQRAFLFYVGSPRLLDVSRGPELEKLQSESLELHLAILVLGRLLEQC